MARNDPGRLPGSEAADLADRVRRFRGAWQPDSSVPMERYLPAPGAPHRTAVLVQLIVVDMEFRAAGGLPVRVEPYLKRFAAELSPATVPVALLGAEYQLRHRFGDQPKLTEYQGRFPDRFDELVQYLAPPEPVTGTRRSGVGPLTHTMRNPEAPAAPSKKVGELVSTNVGEMEATPTGTGGSTILPTGTPYQLIRKIGSGAFGEVFEALAPGGVRVAVKRILRDVDHPASKSEKESLDAIKELSHPFLLKTNAYWVFDDRLVVVMELADYSLADRVEYHRSQGRAHPPFKELVQLFEEAAEALDYLHSQNVSHRDIKPENILILKGHAKVADFGLARFQQHALSVVANTVGTPAYMAPEMWQQRVSLQSDQYSLAATYVKARLGRTLFATDVLIDMANFHINEAPNLDDLPEPERAVLLRALAKSPNERFPSCLEFAQALRAATLTPSMGTDVGLSKLSGGTGLRSTLLPHPPAPGAGTREKLFGALRVLALAVTCALTVVIFNAVINPQKPGPPPDPGKRDDGPVVPPPSKEVVWGGPEGWLPVKGDDATRPVNGAHYYRKLTRTVAGEELVALLVAPTPGQTDHPGPFYVLENKVTNRVFAELWKGVPVNQAPTFGRIKRDYPRYLKDDPVWRKGAEDGTRKASAPDFYLGTGGEQAGVPVLGVTLPEALLVARELHGHLPTFRQWQKAVGLLNDDPRAGPAGAEITVPTGLTGRERAEFVLQKLRERNLALGLSSGPWPVARRTADVSYCGAHQLATNGLEWLASDPEGKPVALEDLNIPSGSREAMVVGRHASAREVPTFDALRIPGAQEWDRATGDFAAGFRVVLKPEPR